jgi:Acetyltransferase (isoleucine patch superfamily)
LRRVKLALASLYYAFILWLPAEFTAVRRRYYNRRGMKIAERTSLSPNVRIRGRVEIRKGSSIAHNCTLSGEKAGIFIGKNVMIAPNVVIVAFNHGFERLDIPMAKQPLNEAPIYIEDDVWIAANCTIAKGVVIGHGSIIGANSLVNSNIPSYSVAAGVPARVIASRKKND